MIPVEQRFSSCPAYQSVLLYEPVINYTKIEKRIMEVMGMDTTIADLYGTSDKAAEDLRKGLKSEGQWRDLFGPEKLVFQEWVFENAHRYKDGNRVDWIGAFYDWLED